MQNTKYNGWTNYETWRVNLEMFDGGDYVGWTAECFEDTARDTIEATCPEGIARGYAMAFLSDVNWHEIAEAYNEQDAA
jgi:hypothetical protein